MEIGGLYQLVLMLVLVGVVAGTGIVALDKFAAITGLSTLAKDSINNASAAIGDIPKTWLGLIVVVAVMAIVITLIIRSFAGTKTR